MADRPAGPVLLVEDHDDSRDAFRAVLEFEGYRVTAVEDGADALAYLATGELPCAVILDLLMPRLNGWQLLAELRRLPAARDVVVIVLSGTNRSPAETAAELGLPVEQCFLKPCDPAAVVRVLRRHCKVPADARRAS
jgi:CheY-like chemotaxis protein